MKFRFTPHFTDIPEWLLLGVIFLLPWQTRWIAVRGLLNNSPWEYGTISVYALDCMIALYVCSVVALQTAQKKPFDFTLSHTAALLLLLITFFSNSFAGNTLSSLFWFAKLAEGILLFFCITHTHIRFHRVAWALSAAGILQSMLAIWQFTTQKVFASSFLGMSTQDPLTLGVQVVETTLGRTLRAYGSLPHPNMLGGFLVICIIAAVILFCKTHNPWERISLATVLAVESTALMMTFSRQSWIALGVALVVLVGYTFIHERTFPSVIAFAIACIAIPMLVFTFSFPELMHTRVDASARLEQKSVNERQTYIEQSVNILQGHWFAGVGIGNDTAYLQSQDRQHSTYKSGEKYQPVHNIYLLAFVELGIFGLTTLLLFILSLFYGASWKNAHTLGWGLTVVAIATIGLFDHYLWSLHFGIMLFWVVTGLYTQSRQAHVHAGDNHA